MKVGNQGSNLFERPFPLLRYFALYVLPLLVVGGVGLGYFVMATTATNIEKFHAERERANAEIIANSVYAENPTEWKALIDGQSPQSPATLVSELEEMGITCLSLFSHDGKLLFTGPAPNNCRPPPLASFTKVRNGGASELHEDIVRTGHWTTLAQIRSPNSSNWLLVAVSRPSGDLETNIGHLTFHWALLFGGVILAACTTGIYIAYRAQNVLNQTAEKLRQSRIRMQRFLSKAARRNATSGKTSATRHNAVVMFADMRNFSGYAETADVNELVSLVDRFVTAVTDAVEAEGGDVDKLLGDGVLAWFDQQDADKRAVRAAIRCIEGCGDLPRRVGIGLCKGEVLALSLGQGERMDFTIIGRSVNLASRLCSSSAEDEISVPSDMIDMEEESIELVEKTLVVFRNIGHPIEVSRYRVRSDTIFNACNIGVAGGKTRL